jgi:putative PIN family toxin of toxin-antitoxin system
VIAATADTNIYISALQFGGLPRQFLNLARQGAFQLAVSGALLEEMRGVLDVKFGWPPQMLDEAMANLARFTVRAVPMRTLHVIEADPDDDRVLECAVAAGSRYIVSGDRHLLALGRYEQIQIVRLAQFMQLLPVR